MIDTGLKGKTVIVTGANHGIGADIAIAFAREGARVLITFLRQSPELYGETKANVDSATTPGRAYYCREIGQSADLVAEEIRALGGECITCEADLSDPDMIPKLFDQAEKRWGAVDVIVNNAAFAAPDTFLPQPVLDKDSVFSEEYFLKPLSAQTHDAHFHVNSRAVALMMAEYAKRHIERHAQWGRIINITTDGARCHPSQVSYGASKFAIESYTRAAATELGPYGITVNVISPGAVQTGWMPAGLEKEIAATYPLRRIGQPEDIAKAVIFFASDQAEWITGQVLQVGGGNRM
ncbi:MAG: SDR family oxidoreductase [Deltaproteobacteria bacterium]|nr:SDR family oxidoreductase [Deltaproteobacteria bacterium]